MTRYESAREIYKKYGIDTDKVIEKLKTVPISIHCWQGDDVIGFDHDGPLTGGIQTTGNYPGKATTPEQLMADIDKVLQLYDDETREMAKEIVRSDALDRVYMALDYFDASINRIAAWTVGIRNWQKALLNAMLTPSKMLKELQDEGDYTKLFVYQEEIKNLPVSDVWAQYCESCNVTADETWFDEVKKYEEEVLLKR